MSILLTETSEYHAERAVARMEERLGCPLGRVDWWEVLGVAMAIGFFLALCAAAGYVAGRPLWR